MTSIATCWKITRTDGVIYAFTDHDRDLDIDGVIYESSAGFVPSSIQRTVDTQTDNQQFVGVIDNEKLDAFELRTGKFDASRIEVIEADWSTSSKVRTLYKGFLGPIEVAGSQYRATAYSIEAELQKPIGRTIKLRCDANLGDDRCGYSLTPDNVTVASVINSMSFADTSLTAADGSYNDGKITWSSGMNSGLTFDVKRYIAISSTIELYEPMPSPAQTGDTALIYRGCDKTLETCRDVFGNVVNFQGFPQLPGVKDLIGGSVA
jgi:uncharacterized phage protein (TIGR02218 family)